MLSARDKVMKKIDGQVIALMKLEKSTKKISKARENRQWLNIL